jgi:hypothetical protein
LFENLSPAEIAAAPRILFRTDAWTDPSVFPSTWPLLEPGLARWLAERGVCLIGVDVPSVDELKSRELPRHHEMDAAGCQIRKPAVVAVATVEDEHGILGELKLAGYLDIGDLALGDDRVLGEQSVVVEEKMDFHGAFGGAVLGPVEDLGAEVNDGAVQTVEFAGDQQRGLGMGGEFGAEMVQQGEKEILIDLPGAVLIGVGQGGMFGGFGDAEMDQFAFAGLESFVDFAEALGLAELTEEHGDELVPTAETAGVAFALMAANDLFKH